MGSIPPGFENYNDVLNDIEARFTLPKLRAVCNALGLPHSGNKGVVQGRIRNYLARSFQAQDSRTFAMAKIVSESQRGFPYGPPRQNIKFYSKEVELMRSRPTTDSIHSGSTSSATNTWGMAPIYQNVRNPVYKRMPFYNLLTYVTQPYNVSACPSSRTSQPIQLRLTPEMLSKLTPKSPTNHYRLALFCTQSDRVHFGNCVVEFPAHTEIRVNGTVIQANVRGIKNKPGTINPPDLTAHAILHQGVPNKVDVTFAETKTAYTLTVYLVEKSTVQQLVEKIRKKGFLSKEATLSKMRQAAHDADIVAGPETLTLKDPISMRRIDLPCKSRYCGHTACFDCATFLTLNEQTPTWTCPICSRSVGSEEDLFLDGYFHDILQNTNKAVESVIIHPDGTWTNKDIDIEHPDAKLLNTNNNKRPSQILERKLSFGPPKAEIVSLDDDDDEETGAPTPASLPPAPSRLSSSSVRASPAVTTPSRKRPQPAYVDLTLSDDDEPAPVRNLASQPQTKRLRTDPPANLHRSSTDSSSGHRPNPLMNGVSPSPSAIRETQIRSPPSSISPRNETNASVFRYNTRPAGTLEPNQLFLPTSNTYSFSNTTSTLLNSSLPMTSSITSPLQTSPSISSLPLNLQFPNHFTNTNSTSNLNLPNPLPDREQSSSPVLPAFQPPPPRASITATKAFAPFDWDSFQNPQIDGSRPWDEDRDALENGDYESEMARIPSAIFEADSRRDSDSGEY